MSRILVLSGGGSHGAWQAGAMRALELSGVSYSAVIGTSVGAVNAAGFAYGGASWTMSLWGSIRSTEDVMKMKITWPWKAQGIYTLNPLKELIGPWITGRSPHIPAVVARLRLSDLTMQYTRLGRPASQEDVDAIAGSCAVAGLHEPVLGHVDGGHVEQAPVMAAITLLGAQAVDVVLSDPLAGAKPGWSPWRLFPIVSNATRALEAMIDEGARNDVAHLPPGSRLFMPKNPHAVSSIEYAPGAIAAMMEQGYKETEEALRHGNRA